MEEMVHQVSPNEDSVVRGPSNADISYLAMLRHILDHGDKKQDRTGTGTTSVFGYQVRHDLTKEFPLLTTKRVHWKSVVHELLWFIRGDTNIRYLKENNVSIWDEWADKDGELGPVYGRQWRHWDVNYIMEQRNHKYECPIIETSFPREIIPDFSSNIMALVGQMFSSRYGLFTVVREYRFPDENRKNGPLRYEIQFHNTGYRQDGVTKQSVELQYVKDRYAPTVCGVGCIGEQVSREDYRMLYQMWCGILKRCYDPSHKGYPVYGGKGVFVAPRWLVFSNFVEDVKKFPEWNLKKAYPDEYSLDKDFHCSNRYGPEDCIWASKLEQSLNSSMAKPLIATIDNKEILLSGMGFAARRFGIGEDIIKDSIATGRMVRGISFRKIEAVDGIPRIRVFDQIRRIMAELKFNPNSRRIILSAWNVGQLNDMALSPCHALVQFAVLGGKLHCHLFQRSADAFLGVPFNIASYALLTLMVAHSCGLQAGELIHSFGDLHIYINHMEQVSEQLSRQPRPAPTVRLNPMISDLEDFRFHDIELQGYDAHPPIKAKVAV